MHKWACADVWGRVVWNDSVGREELKNAKRRKQTNECTEDVTVNRTKNVG